MKKQADSIIYSPSDLIRYMASPFSSWLDRYYLENPNAITPDAKTKEEDLFSTAGYEHEAAILSNFKTSEQNVVEFSRDDPAAKAKTIAAIRDKSSIIFQAALEDDVFAGFADFLILDQSGKYQVWDTKLARSPKPYYAIQLCCYSEMLAAVTGGSLPEKIGIILGTGDRVEFRVEDFIHYYRHIKAGFLAMQTGFSGNRSDCPEPMPCAEHGKWASCAERLLLEKDHLVQVAGITVGQIKKLKDADIVTMAALAAASAKSVHNLDGGTLEKLMAQARLQCQTRDDRGRTPEAKPHYEVLAHKGPNGEPVGLATLPPSDPADVFFDMEGFPDPLVAGGLEYLFGSWSRKDATDPFTFKDWWAHDRGEEKLAFEGFIDWAFGRWRKNPSMHIYHYASYEVSAVRRLSTLHDTRQDEVDDLLRNRVFVDLYKIVRHGLRIGEDSYSLKAIELLYRPKRATDVRTAGDSIVQYANWRQSEQSRDWQRSSILRGLRDYNEDDCKSTAELAEWLRNLSHRQGISFAGSLPTSDASAPKTLAPDVAKRQEIALKLRTQDNAVSLVLADVIDFHRREDKPMWWRMYERAEATSEELRDDPGCIDGMVANGTCVAEKKSFLQRYSFDPSQECKLAADDTVMFTHDLSTTFAIFAIDLDRGELTLKIGKKSLDDKCQGAFPRCGSLLKKEYVPPGEIPGALCDIGEQQLSRSLPPSVKSFLERSTPLLSLQEPGESTLDAALRITKLMSGGCLVIQGPPGTGKTYTASRVIEALLASEKKVGVASNSHKAVVNLLTACGEAAREKGRTLHGIKVGDEPDDPLFAANPGLVHVKDNPKGRAAYSAGIVGGTAWLLSRPEWKDALDFLFIDEAGQVPLANAVAMARCANSLALLGDQMQLEQPVQGSHPGDAGLSALQYALKDTTASKPDALVFHAVVPANLGLFLGESRRMHPNVCRFISGSIYESRLGSLPDCAKQKIACPPSGMRFVTKESGIVFSGVQHDGNIQQSDEEVERVRAIYDEMFGRAYTAKEGTTTALGLGDFLFIAPYNAQVRALQAALPKGSRIASSPFVPATVSMAPAACVSFLIAPGSTLLSPAPNAWPLSLATGESQTHLQVQLAK
jgi:uncharacterized protein